MFTQLSIDMLDFVVKLGDAYKPKITTKCVEEVNSLKEFLFHEDYMFSLNN